MPYHPQERPHTTDLVAGTQSAIVSNIAVVGAWLLSVVVSRSPVEVPSAVVGAISFLMLNATAFTVSYVASRMRASEFRESGAVTGMKRLLVLPLVLSLGLIACGKNPRATEYAVLSGALAVQRFANDEIARLCPSAEIANDPALAEKCVWLVDRNVVAQDAVVAAMETYHASEALDDEAKLDAALTSLRIAVCDVVLLFPETTAPAALPKCERGAVK